MKKKGFITSSVHDGELTDNIYNGAISPLYMSTVYDYMGDKQMPYPRYFNTPNQLNLSKKIAALENCEKGLLFGSGIAAICASMFTFLKSGDHVVLQSSLYGGTINLVQKEFEKFKIDYSLVESLNLDDFEKVINKKTKIIYVETPSNPLLEIIDLKKVYLLAKKHKLISIIDNTFASPVNQNPSEFGIDIIIHSATKYLGGHSDILAGAIASSKKIIDKIIESSINYGGNLSAFTAWLLERSIKTLPLRVKAQNENALRLAKFLDDHEKVSKVNYPGLENHPQFEIAKKQMKGFGGMLSFVLKNEKKVNFFPKQLNIVKPGGSLGGIESTITAPSLTSHAKMTKDLRLKYGISDGLLRFSVGIENYEDLEFDLNQALNKI